MTNRRWGEATFLGQRNDSTLVWLWHLWINNFLLGWNHILSSGLGRTNYCILHKLPLKKNSIWTLMTNKKNVLRLKWWRNVFLTTSIYICAIWTNWLTRQTNKKVITTFSLWILFVQLQSCAYSIKTKSYVVENVVELSLSLVGPKYNLITEPSHWLGDSAIAEP